MTTLLQSSIINLPIHKDDLWLLNGELHTAVQQEVTFRLNRSYKQLRQDFFYMFNGIAQSADYLAQILSIANTFHPAIRSAKLNFNNLFRQKHGYYCHVLPDSVYGASQLCYIYQHVGEDRFMFDQHPVHPILVEALSEADLIRKDAGYHALNGKKYIRYSFNQAQWEALNAPATVVNMVPSESLAAAA
jgi:hypothetical protein